MKLVIELFLLGVAAAGAQTSCICTVRGAFCELLPGTPQSREEIVLVGTVTAVEELPAQQRQVRIRVEESFLGSPASEFAFLDSSGGCCAGGLTFAVGRRYLIAAQRYQGRWFAGYSTGSNELTGRRAELDLRALREWKQGKPLTRSISGMVVDETPRQDPALSTAPGLAGTKVVITGAGVRWERTTDEKGWFLLDGLPAAKLLLTVTPPPGWKPANRHNSLERELDLTRTACLAPWVEVKREQATIRGRLRREDGRTPQYLPVTAVPASADIAGRSFPEAHTNAAGEFTLDGLEPGDYLLAVHLNAQPDSGLVRSYYPGVAEPSQAHRFRVERGQTVDLPEWTLPRR